MNNQMGMVTGRLRVGVPLAPAITPLFVTTDPTGQPRGVSVDIGLALARACGVEADFVVAGTTGELTDAVEAGRLDVAFMPADDERRRRVDFSPPYFVIESTYGRSAQPPPQRELSNKSLSSETEIIFSPNIRSRWSSIAAFSGCFGAFAHFAGALIPLSPSIAFEPSTDWTGQTG